MATLRAHSLDQRLLAGEPPSASPELAERRARLLDPRKRRELAERLAGVLDEVARPERVFRLTAKVPLRRGEIREARSLIEALADELANEPSAGVRGVIMVERLLRDGRSPLYGGDVGGALLRRGAEQRGDSVGRVDSVERAVRHAHSALLMG